MPGVLSPCLPCRYQCKRCAAAPTLFFLQRKGNRLPIKLFQDPKEGTQTFSLVLFVCTHDTGKTLTTIKRDPGKLSAVIIQETWRQADPAPRGNIGKGCVMIGAVEVIDLPRADQAVLNRAERQGRAAADHQGPAIEVLLADQVLACKRIIPVGDEVNFALKKIVDLSSRYEKLLTFQIASSCCN